MAVRKSYKLTEIGEIPEDWEVKNLGSFSEKVGSGITPTGGEKVYKITGHPFVRSQNVGWGILLLNDLVFIDNDTHLTFAHTEIKEKDLLLNITGASIGRCAIANKQIVGGNVNQHVCIIRLDNVANHKFICTYILSPSGQKQINNFQAGGNRQGINFQQVKSINVPFPPEQEQIKIASALSDIDALISSLERLIAKKRLIKQGAMQELLTGKKRLPGFEGEWNTLLLKKCLHINHGKIQITVESQNGIYPILGSGGLIGFSVKALSDGPSVLIGRKGTIDKPQYIETPFWTIDTLFYTDFRICHYPKFFYYIFCTIDWHKINAASGVPSLRATDIEEIEVNVPCAKEQSAIASVLSDMDNEIAALEAKLEKTRQIKSGMMEELLTGRIRLV